MIIKPLAEMIADAKSHVFDPPNKTRPQSGGDFMEILMPRFQLIVGETANGLDSKGLVVREKVGKSGYIEEIRFKRRGKTKIVPSAVLSPLFYEGNDGQGDFEAMDKIIVDAVIAGCGRPNESDGA